MTPTPNRRMGQLSFLAYLVALSVAASVSLDLTEATKVSKIKVNPRGNLWATGHFMGKKSLSGYPGGYEGTLRLSLSSSEAPKAFENILSRRMLEVALAQRAEGRQVRYDAGSEETGSITKIIERYGKNTKKW
ncbi:neuromedin Ba [Narcine bancroftii]|uniref:neuromedin Ba n=1 Tax=Narcine bancroftii TaxID=1343680 RepID=UPI003831045E